MNKRGQFLLVETGNKKAQFYLVAAIIIVMVVSGIASVKTYAIATSKPRNIQDISSELKEESFRIVDYGIYNKNTKNLQEVLEDFDNKFSSYFLKKTENTNIVFIYGDASELYFVQYLEKDTGTVFATLGGASPSWQEVSVYTNRSNAFSKDVGEILTITVLDRDFEFEIMDNEMFYFLITQEKDGEVFVERN